MRALPRTAMVALRIFAAAVPLVPILAGLLLGSVGAPTSSDAASPSSLRPVPALAGVAATSIAAGLPPGTGAVVAVVRMPTTLRHTPGGSTLVRLTARTNFGSPRVALVRRTHGAWLGVVTPEAGNGHIGWIPRAAATLDRIDWELRVSLAAREVTVLRAGRVLERYAVAIGRPSAPTPTGRFAVTDRLLTGDPSGPYGCCILALSAHAPHAIQGWSGGDRIAIHSTPETSSIGQPVSHGCLRLTLAQGRWLLAHIPLGTPVTISSA